MISGNDLEIRDTKAVAERAVCRGWDSAPYPSKLAVELKRAPISSA
jgi:hypothetical protein